MLPSVCRDRGLGCAQFRGDGECRPLYGTWNQSFCSDWFSARFCCYSILHLTHLPGGLPALHLPPPIKCISVSGATKPTILPCYHSMCWRWAWKVLKWVRPCQPRETPDAMGRGAPTTHCQLRRKVAAIFQEFEGFTAVLLFEGLWNGMFVAEGYGHTIERQ